MAQWQRIRLPMQETGVQSLVWQDPTCLGAAKLMRHGYLSLCSRAWEPQLLSPCPTATEAWVLQSLRSATREATTARIPSTSTGEQPSLPAIREKQQRPSTARNKYTQLQKKRSGKSAGHVVTSEGILLKRRDTGLQPPSLEGCGSGGVCPCSISTGQARKEYSKWDGSSTLAKKQTIFLGWKTPESTIEWSS